MMASERYALRILPAGRNDRVAEISARGGDVLTYIFCPREQDDVRAGLDALIRHDLETLEAGEFASKYDIP